MLIGFNNKLVKEGSIEASIFEGTLVIPSVFETLRTYQETNIYALQEHIERLIQSSEILKLDIKNKNSTKKNIEQAIKRLVQANKIPNENLRIKIILTNNFFGIKTQPLTPPPKDFYEKGINIEDTIFERNFPKAKYPNPAYYYFTKTQNPKNFETIFFSDAGFLREGNISNVFAVFQGIIVTPEKNILPGITRQKVLEGAKKLGVKTQIREITKTELEQADEIFLTCTTKGTIPVNKWQNWTNQNFKITKKLQTIFPKN